MASGQKKAILRTFDGHIHAGYLPGAHLLDRIDQTVALLDPAGRIAVIPMTHIRYIAFVRDFNLADRTDPERLTRKSFLARPRNEGLWLRMTFLDGDTLEGLASLDLTLLDDALTDQGLYVIPPDTRSNTQRLYIPRAALASLQILGVITTPSRVTPIPAPTRKRHHGELDLPFPDPR